jgi:hypothetical protein
MMNKKVRLVFQIIVGFVMVAFAFGGIIQTVLLLR